MRRRWLGGLFAVVALAWGLLLRGRTRRRGNPPETRHADTHEPAAALPPPASTSAATIAAGAATVAAGGGTVRALASMNAGAVILAASIFFAGGVLKTHPVPASAGMGITFIGPVSSPATRGIMLNVAVGVNSCSNPVQVTVAASGTAEYWRANEGATPRVAPFAFVIGDPSIRDVRVALARDVFEGLEPTAPRLTDGFTAAPKRDLRVLGVSKNRASTVATGEVTDWGRNWTGLIATFEANWLSPRSSGTCYLQLPSLTGANASSEAGAAEGVDESGSGQRLRPLIAQTADARIATTTGSNVVFAYLGDMDPTVSRPTPTAALANESIWQCRETAPSGTPPIPQAAIRQALLHNQRGRLRQILAGALNSGPLVSSLHGGVALTQQAVQAEAFSQPNCSAVAALEESGAGTLHDFYVLLLGGAIALGMALVVEGVMRLLGVRLGQWLGIRNMG